MLLEAHHAAARKIVLAVHRDLEQLETGRNVSLDLQLQISQNLNALARELHELERLLPGERNSTIWRRKIVELQEESRSQRAALTRFTSSARQQQREAAAEERDALFERRRHNGGDQHAIAMDGLLDESKRIREADSQLDAFIGNGYAVLEALGQQRSALKGIERKVLDLANTLGVSNSVMRVIERRQLVDKAIVYGGMLLTLWLLWFVFVHLRRPAEAEAE
ncbi:hypothetical protein EMIHUDRAFT_253095 [Emiliania huxleyi CCMP1516]|uniref:Membrin n=2 Tax=Emiliania huxleyi TaxID=2903 RepID=A0A0D3JY25_EMIH1|nr:Golgi SNAP receptor complex member 2 [Emiliania huxleyi CCMP1516]XP_005785984.1 hypothetical protein EMIHUDRAFT_253095 [Emiliania huxleyi CCMP1516]EOD28410.1 Golgi SNAP receptor complex member 2 [Emiliania huxleyi CCMP1516]EOD33555.1 hypothetical protein EMIHUDRAFT_253095 [Emiliania huxleyi CCMP1516]|eukprot:XP_005780839.1 Golgi SNAP receptor complex member 2 [Emiliania huxleyi CCMP1516]